ncbi:MAG: hypothetical protein V3T21_03510 [Candidatus Margulisiibacteriota bacterium]
MGDSLSAVKEGLTIVDLLTYKMGSRTLLSDKTAYKTKELGMDFKAIEGGLSKEEHEFAQKLVKDHKLWDPKNRSKAHDLFTLHDKIRKNKLKKPIPTQGTGFSKESPRKISEALTIVDYLSYKSYSRGKLSPSSQEECAKLGVVFKAIKAGKGLSKAGQKAVFQLGKHFLKDRTSDKDLQALLKREALIKTHLCMEDRSACRTLNFRKFRRFVINKIRDRMKKKYKSKQSSALGRALDFIRKNRGFFRIFLMPENQAVAAEIFICALEDEGLSANLNSKEKLLGFLKAKSGDAYQRVVKRIAHKYTAASYPSDVEKIIEERDKEFMPLKALYPAMTDFAETHNKEKFIPYAGEGDKTVEDIMKRAEAEFAWRIPYYKVRANTEKFDKEKDPAKGFKILKEVLPKIAQDILNIPVKVKREEALEYLNKRIGSVIEVRSKADLAWAEKALALFSGKDFKESKASYIIKAILEDRIKRFKEPLISLNNKGWETDLRGLFENRPENVVIIFTATASEYCQKVIKNEKYEEFARANPKLKVYWRHMPSIKGEDGLITTEAADKPFLDIFGIFGFPTIVTFQNDQIKSWRIKDNKLIKVKKPEKPAEEKPSKVSSDEFLPPWARESAKPPAPKPSDKSKDLDH